MQMFDIREVSGTLEGQRVVVRFWHLTAEYRGDPANGYSEINATM